MTDEILRLGIDTRGVDEGVRRAGRSYGEIAKGARSASDENERLERVMQQTSQGSARAAQAIEQSTRANRAMAEATRQGAQAQDIYQRAARERIATEREIARMASGSTQIDAVAAAESYVRAQESYYRQNMARVRLAAAQGLITPQEAARQGQEAAQAYNQAIAGVIQRRAAFQNDRQAFTALAGSLKDVEEAGRRGSLGMHRLNNSLIVMARQATNTHPVVGQLADVVGTFAIGTAKMVPILAGIAAIGFAWQRLTRDAREAREEQERLLEGLERIAERRRIQDLGPGGEAREFLAGADTRAAEIRAQIEAARAAAVARPETAVNQQQRIDAFTADLRELNRQRALVRKEIQDAEREADAEAQRDRDRVTSEIREAEAERAAARREGVELKVRLLKIEADAEARRAQQRRDDHAERLRLLQIEKDAEAARANERRREFELEQKVAAAVQRNEEEAARAQAEAVRAQEQANQKLVQALNNVGRAYGGVTDQVLQLIGAAISLDRMPMNTARDRAAAYASSAAAGVGFGQSTGSPFAGGFGGAVAGFSMAGPAGAIIGGVSGIVSGLIEQGARARRAAEEWDQAMQRWETAYQDRTPAQQRMDQLEEEYRAAVRLAQSATGVSGSIPSLETAPEWIEKLRQIDFGGFREFADLLEQAVDLYEQNAEAIREWQREQEGAFAEDLRVRLLRAQGLEDEAASLELQLRQERELQQAREMGYSTETLALLEQAQAEERLAQARQDEVDAINDATRALNSPSGLNLSLYRWRASMMPSLDTSRPSRTRTGATTGTGVVDGEGRRGGDTYNFHEGAIRVEGSGDPEATAEEVLRSVRRLALRGGGDPFVTVKR